MKPGIKKVKEMFGLQPNRRHLIEDRQTGQAPRTGRGFVYRMNIERRGLNDALYYGLTRRSIIKRKKEHIADAYKEAPINPNSLDKSSYSFKSTTSLVAAILSTAMGTVTEKPDKNRSYLTTYRMYEPSIFALGDYESALIDNRHVTSLPANVNYHYLRHADILNKSAGGEGVYWKGLSTLDRAVAAYYFIEEECNKKSIKAFCENKANKSRSNAKKTKHGYSFNEGDYFLTILYSLYSGIDHVGNPFIHGALSHGPNRKPYAGVVEMIRLLEIFFALEDKIDPFVSKYSVRSTIDRNIIQSNIMRKGLKKSNKHTPRKVFEDLQKAIENYRLEEVFSKGGSLYSRLIDGNTFISNTQAQQKLRAAFDKSAEMILNDINHTLLEAVNKDLTRILKEHKED